MDGLNTLLLLAGAALAGGAAIALLRPLSARLRLLDHPDERKQHAGAVPLVGGLAIFIGMLVTLVWPDMAPGTFTRNLFATAAVLVLLGMLDDRHGLSVRLRLMAQIAASLWMVEITGVRVGNLGHWLGWHVVLPTAVAVPFTVIAVIGLLNAFNLIDGIDGLAGGVTLVAVLALSLLRGSGHAIMPVMVLGAALMPYLACNLGLFGHRRRIFLGDAGSTLIGYVLAWTLIRGSQDASATFLAPTEVLWCVAIPVLDTLAVMIRRIVSGVSPFKPDRGHIHHLLLHAGIRPRATLLVLLTSAMVLFGLGAALHAWLPGASGPAFVLLLLAYSIASTVVYQRQQHQRRQTEVPTASEPALSDLVASSQSIIE